METIYALQHLLVKDIMAKRIVTIDEDDSLAALIAKFQKYGHHGFPVLNKEDKIVGIARDSDVLRMFIREDPASIFANEVKDIMRIPPVTIDPSATIIEALIKMFDCNTRFMPVVENEKVVGILTRSDLVSGIFPSKSRDK